MRAVSTGPVAEHLARLRQDGASLTSIMAAGRVSLVTLRDIVEGRAREVRRDVAGRLLALDARSFSGYDDVDAVYAHVVALRDAGLDDWEISRLCGVARHIVTLVRTKRADQVDALVAVRLLGLDAGAARTAVAAADAAGVEVFAASTVREHLAQLRRSGLTHQAITAASGISNPTLVSIERARRTRINKTVAFRLFAVRPALAERSPGWR